MTVNEAISKIREFLDKGQAADAVAWLQRSGSTSPLLENALGVCLLRAGQYQPALLHFRRMVFPRGLACMDMDVPTTFQTNFITTMLLLGNTSDGQSLLKQLRDQRHPSVIRLRQAIDAWKASHTTMQRLSITLGLSGGRPFTMDLPGDLEA